MMTVTMKCLRCHGTGRGTGIFRKRPNRPAVPCYWCEGTGREPQCKRGHYACEGGCKE